jgi:hypothetical protein
MLPGSGMETALLGVVLLMHLSDFAAVTWSAPALACMVVFNNPILQCW